MNIFMRAIGFSQYETKKKLNELADYIKKNARIISSIPLKQDEYAREYIINITESIGCILHTTVTDEGEYDDYIYPFSKGTLTQGGAVLSMERRLGQECYLGACDDGKSGMNLIFFVMNSQECINQAEHDYASGRLPVNVHLSALSVDAKILLPLDRSGNMRQKQVVAKEKKRQMLEAASKGDVQAMQILSISQMDELNNAYQRIGREDLFSVVDTTFMPYGLECDRYAIVGDIKEVEKITNPLTEENIHKLTVECNELTIEVCINEKDLFGEPQVGRRLKGSIWMQGEIGFLLS